MIKQKAKVAAFVVVWEFMVRADKRREFERAYGPSGVWAKFFRSGKGYIRTDLIRDMETPRRYLTLDFWDTRGAYLKFKKKNRVEYRVIDEEYASLTEGEEKIGEFHGAAG